MSIPDSFPSGFTNAGSTFNDTAKRVSTTTIVVAIVFALVGASIILGIAIAIYKCLKTPKNVGGTPTQRETKDIESTHVASYQETSHSYSMGHVPKPDKMEDSFINNIDQLKFTRYSLEQVSSFTHNFSTKLGQGGFGVVYKGVLPDFTPVAVKVLHSVWAETMEKQFMAEVKCIGKTYHYNLVRLYGYSFEKQLKALVFEYIENGGLDKYLGEEHQIHDWNIMHDIAKGTARGIKYLHEDCHEKIIHFDIKPENILLDGKFCPKVADFGLARLNNKDISHMFLSSYGGTPLYIAPELLETARGSDKCDVYSFGVMLFEILSRQSIRNFMEGEKLIHKWVWEKIEMGEMREVLSKCGIEEKDYMKAKDLIKIAFHCIQYDPKNRPSMNTIVRMLEGEIEIADPTNPYRQVSPLPSLTY